MVFNIVDDKPVPAFVIEMGNSRGYKYTHESICGEGSDQIVPKQNHWPYGYHATTKKNGLGILIQGGFHSPELTGEGEFGPCFTDSYHHTLSYFFGMAFKVRILGMQTNKAFVLKDKNQKDKWGARIRAPQPLGFNSYMQKGTKAGQMTCNCENVQLLQFIVEPAHMMNTLLQIRHAPSIFVYDKGAGYKGPVVDKPIKKGTGSRFMQAMRPSKIARVERGATPSAAGSPRAEAKAWLPVPKACFLARAVGPQPSSSSSSSVSALQGPWGGPATVAPPTWASYPQFLSPEDSAGFLNVPDMPSMVAPQAHMHDKALSEELKQAELENWRMVKREMKIIVDERRQKRPSQERPPRNFVRDFLPQIDPSTAHKNTGKLGCQAKDGKKLCSAWQNNPKSCPKPQCPFDLFHGCAFVKHDGNLVVIINVIVLPFTNTVLSSVPVLVLV